MRRSASEPEIPELAQFRSRRIGLETVGKVEVDDCGKRSLPSYCSPAASIGAPDRQFNIAAHGSAVFFEQSRRLLRAAFFEQRVGIDQVGIADQKRVGKILAEIRQRGERFGIVRRFQVGVAEVIGDVVSQFAGSGLGAVERVDGFGVVVIERASVADRRARLALRHRISLA